MTNSTGSQNETTPIKGGSVSSKEQTSTAWDHLLFVHAEYLAHLDCIEEMLASILPILTARDMERENRMEEIVRDLESFRQQGQVDKTGQLTLLQHLQELVQNIKRFKKADGMFRQGLVTSIVAKFDEFLTIILKEAYKNNSGWLKNPQKTISYKDLLEIESLDKLKNSIISKEVDSLMHDSHYEQVTFLDSKLKLGIEAHFTRFKEFIEITERRNLFVHTGGMISSIYMANCKKWNIPISQDTAEGKFLHGDIQYINNSIDCFRELSTRIVQAATRRLFRESYNACDDSLNQCGFELLAKERWDSAEKIFRFAREIPPEYFGKGEMKWVFLINNCIALKFGGKEYLSELHSVEWAPCHPKYLLAVAVLEDRFSDAAKLMYDKSVQDKIEATGFKSWPLFREFRKSGDFLKAYREIFGKDFTEDIVQDATAQLLAQKNKGSDTINDQNRPQSLDGQATST